MSDSRRRTFSGSSASGIHRKKGKYPATTKSITANDRKQLVKRDPLPSIEQLASCVPLTCENEPKTLVINFSFEESILSEVLTLVKRARYQRSDIGMDICPMPQRTRRLSVTIPDLKDRDQSEVESMIIASLKDWISPLVADKGKCTRKNFCSLF